MISTCIPEDTRVSTEYVTVAEAAALLGLSKQHTNKLIRDGILPAERFFGRWAIHRYAVAALGQKQTQVRFHISVV